MEKYKLYFYVIAVVLSASIIYISANLYGNRNIKYTEVLVNPEK